MKVYIDNSSSDKVYFDEFIIERTEATVAVVVQENHYYPFGMNMKGIEELDLQSIEEDDEHRFQYNGKEKEESFGLYWNDHGARSLDVQLGRWNGVDPLAEKFVSTSSYVSMNNNPIIYVDLDGMEWVDPKEGQALMEAVNDKISFLEKKKGRIQKRFDKRNAKGKKTNQQEKNMADIDSRLDELHQSQEDITKLGNDPNHKYDLVDGDNQGDGKHGVALKSDGVIQIYGSNTGFHIHEVRHVSLSLSSDAGLEFTSDGDLKPTTPYGVEDEIQGYRAQYGYTGSGVGKEKDRERLIKAIGDKMTSKKEYVYPAIRTYIEIQEHKRRSSNGEIVPIYKKNGKVKWRKKK